MHSKVFVLALSQTLSLWAYGWIRREVSMLFIWFSQKTPTFSYWPPLLDLLPPWGLLYLCFLLITPPLCPWLCLWYICDASLLWLSPSDRSSDWKCCSLGECFEISLPFEPLLLLSFISVHPLTGGSYSPDVFSESNSVSSSMNTLLLFFELCFFF